MPGLYEQPHSGQTGELAAPLQMPRGTNGAVIGFARYCASHGNLEPSAAFSALADSFPQELPADQDERNQQISGWIVERAAALAETDERHTAPENDWLGRGVQEAEARTRAEETLQKLADLGIMGDPAMLGGFNERISSYLRYRQRYGEQRMTRSERHYLLGPEQNLLAHLGRRALGI